MSLENLITDLIASLERVADNLGTLNETMAMNAKAETPRGVTLPATNHTQTVQNAPTAPQAAPAAEPVKRGPGRPRKTEAAAAAPKVEAKVEPHSEPAPDLADTGSEPAASSDAPTYEDLVEAIMALAAKKGQNHAKALLLRIGGVDHGKKLSEDRYADVIAAANAELNESDAGLV